MIQTAMIGSGGQVNDPPYQYGTEGDDDITVLETTTEVYAYGGNDIIRGWRGYPDVWSIFNGGTGHDTYIILNHYTVIEEADGSGFDWVQVGESYDLWPEVHVEKLTTVDETSVTPINLYGNELHQEIVGNAGRNILSDGGKGAPDLLRGLGGNDTYHVYNTADVIVEGVSEGSSDWVRTAVTFDLLEDVHVERLSAINSSATTSINLFGNSLKQEITGNAGANFISDGGKGASDTLVGLGGDDTYRVYNAGTRIVEAAGNGIDTVLAAVSYTLGGGVNVEIMRTTDTVGTASLALYGNEFGQAITGNAGSNSLRGYGGDDNIKGGPGNDRISGGPGNDTLAGNTGADTYYFSYALNGATNVDRIEGFSSIDLISLNSAIFKKAGPIGMLAASAFVANDTGAATSADHRITFETDTGILRYDPDGEGAAAAIAFAVITGNTGAIENTDFVIA